MRIRQTGDTHDESSFTSMIDIVFLLLIFFMLQPFRGPDMRLGCHLPKESGGTPPPAEIVVPVRVTVEQDPQQPRNAVYRVDGAVVTNPSALHLAVLRATNYNQAVPVTIDAGSSVAFQHALKAYDQCLVAGVEKVAFAAPPQRSLSR